AGLGQDAGVDSDALWRASELVDEHLGDEPVTPVAPRIAVRAAEHRVPPGLVAALDAHLRAQAAGDRLDEVLDELLRVREEVGWPPLAAPIGQILASQALLNVLSGSRYQTMIDELRALVSGRYGSPPGSIDPTVRRAADLLADGVPEAEPVDLERLSDEAEGLAASDEELLLLALFGDEARPLLEAIRGSLVRAGADWRRDRPRRGADGRHFLPLAAARRAAVRRRGGRGWPRPDALHPRGDEADERGQGGRRGGRPRDPRRQCRTGGVRPASFRARTNQRKAAGAVTLLAAPNRLETAAPAKPLDGIASDASDGRPLGL